MSKGFIDLHTHSSASDGTLSPTMLMYSAKIQGLLAVALTDHDTINGIREAEIAAAKYGIECISGVEFSADINGELHILGLFIDAENESLSDALSYLEKTRIKRNRDIVKKLNGLNVFIDIKKLEALKNASVSRAHIAQLLIDAGYCTSIREAFSKYLTYGKPGYVNRERLSAHDCIGLIHKAGGLAIIAHLNTIVLESGDTYEKFIGRMKNEGIDGLECYYHNYAQDFSSFCLEIADRYDLCISGGSDFHGDNKSNALGYTSSGKINYAILDKLKNRFERNKHD